MTKQCVITDAVIEIKPVVADGIIGGERTSIKCLFHEAVIDPDTGEAVIYPQSSSVEIRLADHPEILAKVEEVVALTVPVAFTIHEEQKAGESQ